MTLKNLNVKSLIFSTSPIIIASAMAFGDGVSNFKIAFLCLIAFLGLQVAIFFIRQNSKIKIKTLGLKELFFFAFCGPLALSVTYYLQSFEMNLAVILAGIPPGLIGLSYLAVDDLLDEKDDRGEGKGTCATRFGTLFSKTQYLFLVISASLIPF